MRCFLAVPASDWVEDIDTLQQRCGFGRALDPDDLHLTLAFLGDQRAASLEALDDMMSVASLAPADLQADVLMLLGGSPPRALAVGCAAAPSLLALHRQVSSAVHQAGITLAHRRFRPHVTFARLPKRYDARAVTAWMSAQGPLSFPPMVATEVVLYRSDLHAEGALYTALARYPIGALDFETLDLEWNKTEEA